MCNTIKRNTIFIEAIALTNSEAFKTNEIIANFKIDGMWLSKDSNGKKWRNLTGNLRNEHYYCFVNQYSLNDIIFYFIGKNEDYATVASGFFQEAIETAFNESVITCIDDLYKYISCNLI